MGFSYAISTISAGAGYSALKQASRRSKNHLVLVVLMMGFWLLLSGMYDLFHISMGVIAVAIVTWLDRKLLRERFFPPHETEPPNLRLAVVHFYYFPWLLWQIVSASLHVAWVILSPRMPLNTSMLRFRADLPTNTARVILGNSITLTPGTLTVDLGGDDFLVHSLTDKSSEGIRNGDMPNHVGKLYGLESQEILADLHVFRTLDDI